MKVSYVEGLANHNGPESCGAAREGGVEALTGESTGRVFSRVRNSLRDADAVRRSGRPHPRRPISRGASRSRAVTDPVHVPKHLAWEPGDPAFTPDGICLGTHREVQGRIPRRRDCWSSVRMRSTSGSGVEKGNRKRSIFLASRTSA